jgi:hypothetical protein
LSRKPSRSKRRKAVTIEPEHRRSALPIAAPAIPNPVVAAESSSAHGGRAVRAPLWTALAVAALLALHYFLAALSLIDENPTVDEVVHLPAGITYWQKGTFRLYHHNPPLAKLVAALPVIWAHPITAPLYKQPSWTSKDPSPPTFSQTFARLNYARYFELFRLARLVMPLFSLLGGVVVFAWSRRLYGVLGGLLGLALWVFCPNVLAHSRLVTTDLASTSMGVAATYVFWRYLQKPSWAWAAAAGVALGAAQLTKFSMLLLYVVWPFFWVVRLIIVVPKAEWLGRIPRALAHGCAIVALSILMIDAGYFFEGVGVPLGRFELGSRALTRPVTPGMKRPRSQNELLSIAWQFRVNRFRGTWLGGIPCPLPEHYVLGFDEQKIETEGIPIRFRDAVNADNRARARAGPTATDSEVGATNVTKARSVPQSAGEPRLGYPVYLNGELRRSGWWYYYLLTLAYKVPEGTWILVLLGLAAARPTLRSRAAWADEIVLWTVPLAVLFSISFFTDINLGLRYVLAIAPYVFIATGKVVPWVLGMPNRRRWVMGSIAGGCVGLTIAATASIHPDYLAYFNWASGGPDRVPARLIDSNLDWGQDLVALQRWCKETIPGQALGLAYFGQINPSILTMRGDAFSWFLPPVRPGTTHVQAYDPSVLDGPQPRLRPGYYAVSATLLYGLPWRLYDPAPPDAVPEAIAPVWNASEFDAFGYFRRFEPVHKIGHSIYVYHLNEEDIARVNPLLEIRAVR